MDIKNPIVFIPGAILPHNWKDGGYFNDIFKISNNRAQIHVVPVKPWASVKENAHIIHAYIEQNLSHEKIHIIAHSKGGLDINYFIKQWSYQDNILSAYLISSPMRGTIVANFLYWSLFLIQKVSYIKPIFESMRDLRLNKKELNYSYNSITASCNLFSTPYPMFWLTIPLLFLFEGANDGMVAVRSSRVGSLFQHYSMDHVGLIGHFKTSRRKALFNEIVDGIYAQIVKEEAC